MGNIRLPLHAESSNDDGSVSQVFSTQVSKCIGFVALAIFMLVSAIIFISFGNIESFGHELVPYQNLESFADVQPWNLKKPRFGY